MSRHNGLPGYDAWKTRSPDDENPVENEAKPEPGAEGEALFREHPDMPLVAVCRQGSGMFEVKADIIEFLNGYIAARRRKEERERQRAIEAIERNQLP